MRALNSVPDGRTDTVVASTTLPSLPGGEYSTGEAVDLMTNRIYAAVDTMRSVHDDVDEADPSTADLLHAIINSLEKAAWMLKIGEPEGLNTTWAAWSCRDVARKYARDLATLRRECASSCLSSCCGVLAIERAIGTAGEY
jgi:starvation-inducible DNA-binding protein